MCCLTPSRIFLTHTSVIQPKESPYLCSRCTSMPRSLSQYNNAHSLYWSDPPELVPKLECLLVLQSCSASHTKSTVSGLFLQSLTYPGKTEVLPVPFCKWSLGEIGPESLGTLPPASPISSHRAVSFGVQSCAEHPALSFGYGRLRARVALQGRQATGLTNRGCAKQGGIFEVVGSAVGELGSYGQNGH